MNVDSIVLSDVRFDRLAEALKITRDHAVGAIIRLWFFAYENKQSRFEFSVLAGRFGAEFIESICAAKLAQFDRGIVRINGVEDRIKWLLKQSENGKKGQKVKRLRRQASASASASTGPLKQTLKPILLSPVSCLPSLQELDMGDQGLLSLEGGVGEGHSPPVAASAPALSLGGKKSNRKRPVGPRPADFAPNASHAAIAAERGLDLDRELLAFADWHDGKGNRFADWDAALRTWLRRAHPETARAKPTPPAPSPEYPSIPWAKHEPDGAVDPVRAWFDAQLDPVKPEGEGQE